MGTEATDLIIRTIQRSDPWYQLIEIDLALDRTVLGSTESAGLQDPQHFVRVPGVAAGPHTLMVRFFLRGKGTGDYAYRAGYKFKVVTGDAFTLASAQTTCISILLYFHPNTGLDAFDRLLVDFKEERTPLAQ